MSYAAIDDLIARFGEDELTQLTDRDGSGSLDSRALETALDESASVIDSYLRGRYALPLLPVPKLLTGICCDLTRYALYADAVPDALNDRQRAALSQLRDLAAGRARLEVGVAPDAPAGRVVLVSAERLFTRESR
jgi:phage gp36-like protein